MSASLIPVDAPAGHRSICSELHISRSTAYGEMKAGRLKTVKVGRRRFTTDELLAEYIGGLPVHGGDAA